MKPLKPVYAPVLFVVCVLSVVLGSWLRSNIKTANSMAAACGDIRYGQPREHYCLASLPWKTEPGRAWFCMRPHGHIGMHMAGTCEKIEAAWPDTDGGTP